MSVDQVMLKLEQQWEGALIKSDVVALERIYDNSLIYNRRVCVIPSQCLRSLAPAARDVFSLDGVYLPSSVGATSHIPLLRSLGARPRGFYKYVAPTEPDLIPSELRTVFT